MHLLSIDPSLRGTGYAILDSVGNRTNLLEFGVIKNHRNLLQTECLVEIYKVIQEIIVRFQPAECAVESVIFVQSIPTAIVLGAARGASLLAVAQQRIPIYEYAPKKVKQAVVGRGAADKKQVAFMIRAMLGLTETPPPDAADAIAIGLTHLQAKSGLRLQNNPGVSI